MFIRDNTYRAALKRLFATTFFDSFSYKNIFKRYSPPVYLTQIAGSGRNVNENFYAVYFYNKKINIDFDNTIVVKERSGVIDYKFYYELPEAEKLYSDIYIENGDGGYLYAGTKFRDLIL